MLRETSGPTAVLFPQPQIRRSSSVPNMACQGCGVFSPPQHAGFGPSRCASVTHVNTLRRNAGLHGVRLLCVHIFRVFGQGCHSAVFTGGVVFIACFLVLLEQPRKVA